MTHGSKVLRADLQSTKSTVDNALSKTGQTFTWDKFVDTGTIKADGLIELKNAVDKANDNVLLGCIGKCSANHNTDYSTQRSSHKSQCDGNNPCSDCPTHNSSAVARCTQTTACGSNKSSYKSSFYTAMYASDDRVMCGGLSTSCPGKCSTDCSGYCHSY